MLIFEPVINDEPTKKVYPFARVRILYATNGHRNELVWLRHIAMCTPCHTHTHIAK